MMVDPIKDDIEGFGGHMEGVGGIDGGSAF